MSSEDRLPEKARGYTLADFYRDAGITPPAEEAEFIPVSLPGGSEKPWKVQIDNLALAYHYNWWALYWEPGAGKTVVAQAWGLLYAAMGEKVVVVTLASLVYQFQDDYLSTFPGANDKWSMEVLDLAPKEKKVKYEQWDSSNWPSFLVMGYERFALEYEVLQEKGYRCLVVDEAWRLSNHATAAHRKVTQMRGNSRDSSALLLMNGTPIKTTILDAYGNISLVDDEAYESYDHFESTHVKKVRVRLRNPITTKSGRKITSTIKIVGFKNHDLLYKNLYRRGSRVLKVDVAELEDPIIFHTPVKLTDKHLALYRKLSKERILELSETEIISAVNDQSLRQKILQLVSCPELFIPEGETIENRLIVTLDDIISGINLKPDGEGSKLIVFANFLQTVDQLRARYKDFNPAIINGTVSGAQRRKQEIKFKTDETCRMGIFNPLSAGAGFNFQHICNYMVFFEPMSSPGMFKQAMDRIVRPGQKWTPTVWVLRALNTVAAKRIDTLIEREQEAQLIYRDRVSLLDYFTGG